MPDDVQHVVCVQRSYCSNCTPSTTLTETIQKTSGCKLSPYHNQTEKEMSHRYDSISIPRLHVSPLCFLKNAIDKSFLSLTHSNTKEPRDAAQQLKPNTTFVLSLQLCLLKLLSTQVTKRCLRGPILTFYTKNLLWGNGTLKAILQTSLKFLCKRGRYDYEAIRKSFELVLSGGGVQMLTLE